MRRHAADCRRFRCLRIPVGYTLSAVSTFGGAALEPVRQRGRLHGGGPTSSRLFGAGMRAQARAGISGLPAGMYGDSGRAHGPLRHRVQDLPGRLKGRCGGRPVAMKNFRLLSVLVACSAGFMPNPDTSGKATASDCRRLHAIAVDVVAPGDISDSLVNRLRTETDAIWKPAGIAFNWHRMIENDASGLPHLTVTIDNGPRDAARSHATLGRILFTPEGPDKSIHLSLAGIEDLLLRTEGVGTVTTIAHDILVGRALGRTLSHEVGHYLLNTKAHTPQGLMRAEWPSRELFALNRGGFELSSEERKAAARRAEADGMTGTNRQPLVDQVIR